MSRYFPLKKWVAVEMFSHDPFTRQIVWLTFKIKFKEYTVDHGTNHPAAKLGGIIEGVHAKDISNLTKSKSPRAATFFGQRVDI